MSDQTKQQEARSLPATFAKNEFEKDAFILRQLVTKDFKIKYRRSVLGVAWSVLNPLLMMIVMAIVFSTIFGQGRNGSMTPEMYPLYLIVGNVTFAVMSESTNQALTSIVGAAPLLKKVKVHRWVFPVQKVLFSLVNFAFSLVAVAIVMLWFRVMPSWHLILLPVCLLLLMCFCMGLGMMLSALTVFSAMSCICGALSLRRGLTSRLFSGLLTLSFRCLILFVFWFTRTPCITTCSLCAISSCSRPRPRF